MHQLGNAVDNVLTPDERIALIGNEWALMRIGKHSVGDYLALADATEEHARLRIAGGFSNRLDFINELHGDRRRPAAFQAWLRNPSLP